MASWRGSGLRVVGFIGPSGTGKSHRALWVARENKINYLIDDGLLIHENGIVAGHSAKKAPTKIGSVKAALFQDAGAAEAMRAAFERKKPEAVLILGTSEGMVDKISSVLGIGPVLERIYIHEVATQEEIDQARSIRVKQGKHVIPVPALELKKQFSGYFLDPLQIFRRKGTEVQHVGEKTVVRPTFSYYGRFIISDYAIYQVVQHILDEEPAVEKMTRFRTNNGPEGLYIDMDLMMRYGYPLQVVLQRVQETIGRELDRFAGLVIRRMQIHVKGLVVKNTTKGTSKSALPQDEMARMMQTPAVIEGVGKGEPANG